MQALLMIFYVLQKIPAFAPARIFVPANAFLEHL